MTETKLHVTLMTCATCKHWA